jgi:hypothetical protein
MRHYLQKLPISKMVNWSRVAPNCHNKRQEDNADCGKILLMITHYERSDIIHIMNMNRLTLSDSDTAELCFNGRVKDINYQITILVVEDLPQVYIKQNGEVVFNTTVKSVDDLKIFLEERLYKYLEV